MFPALTRWDGEQLVVRRDRPTGAWLMIAIHSTRLGPAAAGGTRMRCYDGPESALEDLLRLSRVMTYKTALAGVPFGGGKGVIALERALAPQQRCDLLRSYGRLVASLGGRFVTGPDMGTGSEDMDVIAETGGAHVHSRTLEAGGAGDSGPGTAVGVMAGIETAAVELGLALPGLRVLVMGAGGVGAPLIEQLRTVGAEVCFCDPSDEVAARHAELRRVTRAELYETECDVFAPCAGGGVLDGATISRLRCRAVVGSANNPLASEADAEALEQRGILYAPDMVVSIGGFVSVMGLEQFGWSREQAYLRIRQTVGDTLREVLAYARRTGRTSHQAAIELAQARIQAASSPGGS